MSGPRVPISQINGGNKRQQIHRVPSSEKPYCAQHDDLIKFIFESWDKVSRDSNHGNATYYQEPEPNPELKSFEPFDLEAWWGRRMVQNMTQIQHS